MSASREKVVEVPSIIFEGSRGRGYRQSFGHGGTSAPTIGTQLASYFNKLPLELLDKEGARSFSAEDMEDLSLFANQAAVAIEQSRTNRNLVALLGGVLESLGQTADGQRQELRERTQAFAERLEGDAPFNRALGLAQLVQEIAYQGENELKGCEAILRGFAEYLRSRPDSISQLEAM